MGPDVPKFRIVVTGYRYWNDFRVIHEALRYELMDNGQFLLGVGDCESGADDIALRWGSGRLEWPVTVFHAPWTKRGKAGGPVRNKFMIDMFRPHLVLAFIAPESRGTVNCANYAESQGIAIRRFFQRRGDGNTSPQPAGPDSGGAGSAAEGPPGEVEHEPAGPGAQDRL